MCRFQAPENHNALEKADEFQNKKGQHGPLTKADESMSIMLLGVLAE